ncbi:DUF6688 domain-containing protein [Tenacibaculum finnmarkense]|uniref:DUF6688 domain-containing protein n=1 Tax=Tenacibaculum finnmarkense TaxID=2781243 RepID=UPI001EFBFECF|nr:DUF6688 family protein [Tenacibaculum finnmarkense]MCG8235398.1 hypothetical protein [Tenacibaculum finnmarkense genomovar ulcerans]MCG8829529.1 hypothetical protein [Tenacibaculum finnmarkense]
MEFLLIIFSLFIISLFFAIKLKASAGTIITVIIHLITFIPFLFCLLVSAEHNIAIDPMDQGYTPLGQKHMLTVFVFYILYVISKILIWKKSKILPPLTWGIATVFVVIGIVLNIFIILQTSYSNDMFEFNSASLINTSTNNNAITFFLFYPLISSISAIYILAKSFNIVANHFDEYQYQNSILSYLHKILFKIKSYPLLILLLIFPVFCVITIILMLFGQDADSMIKVFTDTTTWRFSQQSHPPALDHKGHYLCTVAARGNPKIVKPIRIGKRHGKPIVINRQLMIANAFEDLIQVNYPKTHHFIRKNYDTYGYNLSKVINTPFKSDVTYIIMKPLEWFFIIFLYLFCTKPEELIKRQYR